MVNDRQNMDLLHEYVGNRIDVLRSQLETANEIDRIRQIQGSIQELKRFKTLREETIKEAE